MYDKVVSKVNSIDPSKFVLKPQYNTDKSGLKTKIDYACVKTVYNIKTNEIKGKMRSISGLATTTDLNTVKNRIPDFSNLSKKTDHDSKISDIESKYFTISDYNKFMN